MLYLSESDVLRFLPLCDCLGLMVRRADLIVADNVEQSRMESGDLLLALRAEGRDIGALRKETPRGRHAV